MSVSQRFDLVKKKNLCINCFSSSHIMRNCSSSSCRVCSQKHHTMLHQIPNDRSSSQSKSFPPSTHYSSTSPSTQNAQTNISNKSSSQLHTTLLPEPQTPSTSETVTSLISTSLVGSTRTIPSTVLLQTALVKVFDLNGHTQWARALLDPASQLNLITENLVQKLKLRRYPDYQEIGGVGNSFVVSSHTVKVRIGSHCSDFVTEESCHILKRITHELPTRSINKSSWIIPSDITLADPKFYEPGSIDLLLGMEMYYDLLLNGFIKLGPEQPIMQNTVFGWVASGKIDSGHTEHTDRQFAHVCGSKSLEKQLYRFWDLESCWRDSTHSLEESACEEHFSQFTFRDTFGRFVVTLPKRQAFLTQLGHSKQIATRRFLALERRLDSDVRLKESYSNFIQEYLSLNHMREIDDEKSIVTPSYYLPHHCVQKADSTTTKLRVVFDASSRTDSGVSLNQALMVGPVIQDDLFSLIVRFRIHKIAIIADIEKMFRQIGIHPSDHPLHRILWRNSSQEPIRTFELTTVTYGTASAPYLATRCLKELAKQESINYPNASRVLENDFFMDDMLTGVNTIEEGKELCTQLIQLLQLGGFNLRKWASNSNATLSKIPAELRDERSLFTLDVDPTPIKALGLQWEPSLDRFKYAIPEWSQGPIITRRVVLSDTAKLYDPLGLIGPVVVIAKIFIQTLWQRTNSWDEPLEEAHQKFWLEFRSTLNDLSLLSIPRWVACRPTPAAVELHGFCDASEKAYGACIYMRTVSADGIISVHLMAAKSRVAPLGVSKGQRRISLPRLELSSALLLSHLFNKINTSIPLNFKPFFWTDSLITLHWLRSTPSRWKTFIANRVSEVQHLTANGIWAHVPGIDNPADIISRGMYAVQLKDTAAWWNGPSWLSQQPRFWPALVQPPLVDVPVEYLEERPISLPIQASQPNELFYLRSSFSSMTRLVALLMRFIHNTRAKNHSDRHFGNIQTFELGEAVKTLVRIAQREVFAIDIAAVSKEGQVKPNSRLKTLSPIMSDGILRVGGRLRNASIPEDRKHPMILPSRHPLTDTILQHYHTKYLHAGPQLLVACVREKYWPLSIRNLARKVVHSCIHCFRCRPSNLQQIMGDLPPERITPTLPFVNTGVDLCGPFQYRKIRKTQPVKCYIAIFVCLVTKAVHIEPVYDLSTAAFIAALHRFISRRGKPKIIECDNGRNFTGASRELADLARQFRSQNHQSAVIKNCAEEEITFKFIPPRSPHFGGLWESAVKSFKRHFRSTVGNSILTQDEFVTLLTRIEACLNSRPLTPLSADPNDLEVLTPGHFLVHRSLTSIPEPDLSAIPRNRLDRWQENQELLRRIWKRWTTDYLSGLHPRTRWTQVRDNISIGTMVLLKEENLPPLKWKYGRITQIFRGDDNHVRVVSVRTADGEYRRAIAKICVLPIHQATTTPTGDASSSVDFI
ncbi:uncharacterized protein LOC129765547 [Toxorhynchites rutilus septentrionalis]|uniref:uncharacterized protein LOC129765547 n=1 Tax=Toxorhynchites rutilus septentrionalis TaxID=329112 RepID=UPI002479CAEA|nr:uncharacterized protein LOC129765547 [Toxorhynchites rutilus septentrionalis]